MTLRPLFPLVTLLALMLAPLGRSGAAEAAAPVQNVARDMAAMPQHCSDMPMPADHEPAGGAIDCMIACVAVTPSAAVALPTMLAGVAAPETAPLAAFVGIKTGSDPPPPRLS